MTLNRRIERLENRLIPHEKLYRFTQKVGESSDEAGQRYCQEQNITEDELEAGMVIQIVLVSPEDVRGADNRG
ncbi:MAG: hypothetical protein HKN34_01370 [Gammaproteobacteria bacterium]|nr:hypothetical protein [Gammaproteobacteria bacterium]